MKIFLTLTIILALTGCSKEPLPPWQHTYAACYRSNGGDFRREQVSYYYFKENCDEVRATVGGVCTKTTEGEQ